VSLSGRKPTPAALIDAADHKKSAAEIDKRRKTEEGLLCKASLTVPDYISDNAKKEWRRVMKLYRTLDTKILCDLDAMALVIYCEAVSIYKKAQETWKKYNFVVSGNAESQRVIDKCFQIMEKQTKIINELAEQLCLTPVGRARMGVATAKAPVPINTINEKILEALTGRASSLNIEIPEGVKFQEDEYDVGIEHQSEPE